VIAPPTPIVKNATSNYANYLQLLKYLYLS